MKLCIPVGKDEGVESEIYGHFGSAPWFLLYDCESKAVEALANAKVEHEHGQCRPMDLLANRGIAAVVCKGMGRNAVNAVQQQEVKVFTTAAATVRGAIDDFMAGRLIKLDPENSCQGHACH